MLGLIYLNLFYCTFIFKKRHQLFLCIKWFWNVFYVYSVLFLSVFTIIKRLVFLILRTWEILLKLWWFLYNRWRWNPSICSFVRWTWRKRKEREWRSKSLWLFGWLFLEFGWFTLDLISLEDTLFSFYFFCWLPDGHLIAMVFL